MVEGLDTYDPAVASLLSLKHWFDTVFPLWFFSGRVIRLPSSDVGPLYHHFHHLLPTGVVGTSGWILWCGPHLWPEDPCIGIGIPSFLPSESLCPFQRGT